MTRDYEFVEYAMYLSYETFAILAQTVCQFTKEEWDEDEASCIEEISDCLDGAIASVGQFTGAVVPITSDGAALWSEEQEIDDDTVYYIPLDNEPKLFAAAYKDTEEIVNELKQKIGKYLPEDFDYAGSIRMITGTYWC